ncbi:hypothetical protein LUZ60_009178 [Juncus effusus]|nr:hypothetical protein LUZ60_009178 [Juncus effusus]
MAKRELSNTLRNLKFMQRASVSQKPDKTKEETEKKDQSEIEKDEKFTSPNLSPFGASPVPTRKCVVIMEGNPHPGAIKGRMSFQSFNANIDKLNEEATNHTSSVRVDGSTSTSPSNEPDPDLKRKNRVSENEKPVPNKLQKNVNGDINNQPSSSNENNNNNSGGNSNNKRKEFKKPPKRDKLDWSVLRPPRKP